MESQNVRIGIFIDRPDGHVGLDVMSNDRLRGHGINRLSFSPFSRRTAFVSCCTAN